MLADPDSKIIRAFGILNESVPKDNMVYGVPHPGTYILDENGVVRAKYFEDDYRERFTAANILWRQFGDRTGARGATAETPHLRISTIASDAEARAGTRLALALEIELKPGMHVYAPGVEGGYIPVDWTIAESNGWKAHEVVWPASRKLRLEAIHETVPVFEGKFRLTRDVTIGQQKDFNSLLGRDRTLTVEGTFRYQACDAKECFPPQKIPVKWSFHVNPLDGQRAPADLRRK
jgi:DsbC/DsbD-like thiol-disulfide interchange protein